MGNVPAATARPRRLPGILKTLARTRLARRDAVFPGGVLGLAAVAARCRPDASTNLYRQRTICAIRAPLIFSA